MQYAVGGAEIEPPRPVALSRIHTKCVAGLDGRADQDA